MRKTRKFLMLSLFVCLSMIFMPGMESYAEEMPGEQASAESGLTDENPQRLEEVTAMDEDGNIYQVDDEGGEVSESGIARFSMARTAVVKVVNFRTKGNAVTEYKEFGTGTAGYTNGAYGADAAYLGTSGGKVRFMLSGVVGEVSASEVQVVDFANAKSVSCYQVSGGRLLHYITQDMTTPGHATSLDNGAAPSYLQSGATYYSYDGHYFYTSYGTMLGDYQNNTRSNSVNPNSPYYNYYQYLPFRSRTSYSAADLNNLINGRTSSASKLRNTGDYLVNSQNTYGVNALIMTAIAANESGWGTSSICKNKNNLFGLNAVDSSPGTSASTYASVEECIRQYADGWMSRGYLKPSDWRYKGGFLGNKASGVNVSYASDPYWGEKAANILWMLDANGGGRDANAYTIGIKDSISTQHTSVNVRGGSSTAYTSLYMTGLHSSYAVLIQNSAAENGFYRIQSDAVLNGDRSGVNAGTGQYDFDSMYAYISANYVSAVNQGGTVEVKKELQSIYISQAPAKTAYTAGEIFDPTGMGVVAKWSDGTETDVTQEVTYPTEALQAGQGSVAITYAYEDMTASAEQSITVAEPVAVTEVKIDPSQVELKVGESLNFGVLVIGTGNPLKDVTWSVEGALSADTQVDQYGKLQIGADETTETLKVKAVSVQDVTKSAEAVVTVVKEEAVEPEQPELPGEDVTPDVPDTPGEAENPGVSETPGEAGNPNVPETPDGSDNPNESDTPETPETEITVTSEDSKVWVTGTLPDGAQLKVAGIADTTEEYARYTEAVKGQTILGVYDISLTEKLEKDQKVELGLQVDEQYNGREIVVLHYSYNEVDGNTYVERYLTKAEEGKIAIEVTGFSPYVVALNYGADHSNPPNDGENTAPDNTIPGNTTPDNTTPDSNTPSGGNDDTSSDNTATPDTTPPAADNTNDNGADDLPANTVIVPPAGEGTGNTDSPDVITDTKDPSSPSGPSGQEQVTMGTDTKDKNAASVSEVKDTIQKNTGKNKVQNAVPKTGDESRTGIWTILLAVSMLGVIYSLKRRKTA